MLTGQSGDWTHASFSSWGSEKKVSHGTRLLIECCKELKGPSGIGVLNPSQKKDAEVSLIEMKVGKLWLIAV